MADASTIIHRLGMQLAQALVDKTIAQVELAETQQRLAELAAEKETSAE
jgi:hypothetical protein